MPRSGVTGQTEIPPTDISTLQPESAVYSIHSSMGFYAEFIEMPGLWYRLTINIASTKLV